MVSKVSAMWISHLEKKLWRSFVVLIFSQNSPPDVFIALAERITKNCNMVAKYGFKTLANKSLIHIPRNGSIRQWSRLHSLTCHKTRNLKTASHVPKSVTYLTPKQDLYWEDSIWHQRCSWATILFNSRCLQKKSHHSLSFLTPSSTYLQTSVNHLRSYLAFRALNMRNFVSLTASN